MRTNMSNDFYNISVHRYKSTRCSLSVWSTVTLKTLKEFEVDCGSWGKINNIIMTCDKRFAVIFVQAGQGIYMNYSCCNVFQVFYIDVGLP